MYFILLCKIEKARITFIVVSIL